MRFISVYLLVAVALLGVAGSSFLARVMESAGDPAHRAADGDAHLRSAPETSPPLLLGSWPQTGPSDEPVIALSFDRLGPPEPPAEGPAVLSTDEAWH